MEVVKGILRFLRKTDEVDTISKDTKEFLEQNDASLIFEVIDENRSNDKGNGSKTLDTQKSIQTIQKNGKTYVLKKVGGRSMTPV